MCVLFFPASFVRNKFVTNKCLSRCARDVPRNVCRSSHRVSTIFVPFEPKLQSGEYKS